MRSALSLCSKPLTLTLLLAATWATPLLAQPRMDAERSELVRQLSEYKQRVRQLEERLQKLEEQRARARVPARRAAVEGCALPFYLDSSGLKHLRPECVDDGAQVSCDMPFQIDGNGIKRFRAACHTEATARAEERAAP